MRSNILRPAPSNVRPYLSPNRPTCSGTAATPLSRHLVRACVLLLTVAVSGCSSFPKLRPDPPKVSVAGVRPLNISFTRQRLEFRLLVENPNAFDLPLRSLDFVANIAGEKMATGSSDEHVTIPANGEAEIAVEVVTGIDRVIDRLRGMIHDRTVELDYDVTGTVKLANWPRRIPFDVGGVLPNPQRVPSDETEPDDTRNDGDGDVLRHDDDRGDRES